VDVNYNQFLHQVRILDPVNQRDEIVDVWLAGGQIKAIAPHLDLPENTNIIEAEGLVLAPGLVDLYSHSGEPGYEDRETLASLAAAGAAGGFTRIALLPDTVPPVDNPATLALLQQKSQTLQGIATTPQFYFWGCLTQGLEGKQMTELGNLAQSGIVGFADGKPIENLLLLRRLLEYVQPLGKPVALFPCSQSLRGNGVMREGAEAIAFGLPSTPVCAEAVALAAILELVAEIGTFAHILRVSTRRGVELIADAKARGIPVTASTTWMHLLFNSEALAGFDPNLRLEPPLGNKTDGQALIEGVKNGIIDAIAIDHTPYSYEEKTLAFAEAPPGVIGLELALPLLWETFVNTGQWSALELWQSLSAGPQLCLQQQPLTCTIGEKAELVLFDPQQAWKVGKDTLKSLSLNTPWLDKQIFGRVVQIWN
jgi:dihydroorotase